MNQESNETEVRRILKEIRTTEYSTIQSVDLLLEYGFKLTQYMSFTGEEMADAKENLLRKRAFALENFDKTIKRQVGPAVMKSYVDDRCAVENGYYELCERSNRACVHTIELIRTAVSALKQEKITQSYSNTR